MVVAAAVAAKSCPTASAFALRPASAAGVASLAAAAAAVPASNAMDATTTAKS